MPFQPALRRAASALLAAAMTLTILAAFLLPAPSGPSRPAREGSAAPTGQMVVYARPLAAGEAAPAPPAPPARTPDARAVRPPERRPVSEPPVAATPAPTVWPASPASPAAPVAPTPPTPQLARREPGEPGGWPAAGLAGNPPGPVATVPEATPGAAAPTPAAPLAARAASAPLRLDRSVVREASRASRSAVQQMAEASGQPAGDRPVSAEQRLADSVARTVKPDCLPPGGTHGLLTPLVAAYKMATDSCRNR